MIRVMLILDGVWQPDDEPRDRERPVRDVPGRGRVATATEYEHDRRKVE
jgi:hypothetical protein